MLNEIIQQNVSFYNKLVKKFRPNFNLAKHLAIAADYYENDIHSEDKLSKKYDCSAPRIHKILVDYQTRILPAIEALQKEDQ